MRKRTYPRPCTQCGVVFDEDGYYVKYKATGSRFSWCKACHLERTGAAQKAALGADPEGYRAKKSRFRADNAEHYRETARIYREKNSERCREQARTWTDRNRERLRELERARYPKIREAKLAYRKTHADRYAKLAESYKKIHAEKNKAIGRAYYLANKAKFKANHTARRSRSRGAPGRWTGADWETLKARYGHRCLRCGKAEPEIKLTPDHVVPLARGGTNFIDNIQPLCFRCNVSKNARHSTDYRPAASIRRPDHQLPLFDDDP